MICCVKVRFCGVTIGDTVLAREERQYLAGGSYSVIYEILVSGLDDSVLRGR
jgi:hypothetical protein